MFMLDFTVIAFKRINSLGDRRKITPMLTKALIGFSA
jgi:hypothetical protein